MGGYERELEGVRSFGENKDLGKYTVHNGEVTAELQLTAEVNAGRIDPVKGAYYATFKFAGIIGTVTASYTAYGFQNIFKKVGRAADSIDLLINQHGASGMRVISSNVEDCVKDLEKETKTLEKLTTLPPKSARSGGQLYDHDTSLVVDESSSHIVDVDNPE